MSRRSLALALLVPTLSVAFGQSKPAPNAFRAPSTPKGAPTSSSEAPFSLTASDGSGLRLTGLTARAVVEGPLALTELHLTFQNPEPRLREGTFQITLPSSGTVSRFAMLVNGAWVEGEMVERQRARQAYEDFLHRRQDPALLEQSAANVFSARVFPIPAGGTKEIILSYTQEIAGAHDPYRLPLVGLPQIDNVDLSVQVSRSSSSGTQSNLGGQSSRYEVVTVQKQGWIPDQDLIVTPSEGGARGLRAADLVVARVSPQFPATNDEVRGLYVLVDTSASRALGLDAQVDMVTQITGALANGAGPSTPLAVAAFDQGVTPIYEGTAGGWGSTQAAAIRSRMALGASDPQGALVWLHDRLKGSKKAWSRVLVVTDGVSTAGEQEAGPLRDAARSLGEVGVARLDALAMGGIRDDAALHAMVTAGLPRDGVVVDGDLGLNEAARRLSSTVRSGIKVEIPGADWVWPETLDAVQPGDEILVYAGLSHGGKFALNLDGAPTGLGDQDLASAPLPLLERATAQARIERLTTLRETRFAKDEDLREAMKQQAIQLSLRERVLSPWTALLVLETNADYARFGLDRNALADVLTVGPTGITVLDRRGGKDVVVQQRPVTTTPPRTLSNASSAPGKTSAPVSAPSRRDTHLDLAEEEEDAVADDAPMDRGAEEEPMPVAADASSEALVAAPQPRSSSSTRAPEAPSPRPMASRSSDDDEESEDAPSTSRRSQQVDAEDLERIPTGRSYQESASQSAGVTAGSSRSTPSAPASSHGNWRSPPPPPPPPPPTPPTREERPSPNLDQEDEAPAWSGTYEEVMDLLVAGKKAEALARAKAWHAEEPGDVLALLALGAAFQANGDPGQAARCYGSLIDLFPSRADLRRTAGNWLEALNSPAALQLAVDTYRQAVAQRPDHPNSHRMLAWALLGAGHPAEAFDAIEAGAGRGYPSGRFLGVDRILREDAGLIGAAWLRAEPSRREEILSRLAAIGATLNQGSSLRFILSWETDANDVDFHIRDRFGNEAYYGATTLASGGDLYADVTTGYGPECFTIPGVPKAWPYKLQAHYYRRGPMGFGMGTLVAIQTDGQGGIVRQSQPFVVMNDDAFLDLGTIRGPLR